MASQATYKFLTFFLLILLAGFFAWTQLTHSESAIDATEELAAPDIGASAPVPVDADTAVIKDLVIRISASGGVRAARQLVMTSEVAGTIKNVYVREGQRVRSGAVLANLDDTDFRLQLREAEEKLLKATIDYGSELGERAHSLVESPYGENLLEIEGAKTRYEQAKAALKKGDIERDALDLAEREYAAAKVFNETSKKSLIASRSGLTPALIAKERARLALERTRFVAPFDGAVGDLKIGPFMHVSAGAECLTLVDLSTVLVEIEVLESESRYAKVGSGATAAFTAFAGEEFSGEVVSVNPMIDPKNKTRRVTVRIENSGRKLLPGMFCFVKLEAEIHQDRLLVPKDAVVLRDQRPVVFIARPDAEGKLRAVWCYVEIGLRNEAYVEILSSKFNLEPGEPVVTSNHYTMIHDALIKIMKAQK